MRFLFTPRTTHCQLHGTYENPIGTLPIWTERNNTREGRWLILFGSDSADQDLLTCGAMPSQNVGIRGEVEVS